MRCSPGRQSLCSAPPTRRARPPTVLLALGAAATFSCALPPTMSWDVVFACGGAPDGVVAVRTRVLDGGCDGAPVYEGVVQRVDTAGVPPAPGSLPTGEHGFEAAAMDEDGTIVSSVCKEIAVGVANSVLLVLPGPCDASAPTGGNEPPPSTTGGDEPAPADERETDASPPAAPPMRQPIACETIGETCMDDACPADPDKLEPGLCGCGVPETDSDGDGMPDCADSCPTAPQLTEPSDCGCNTPDDAVAGACLLAHWTLDDDASDELGRFDAEPVSDPAYVPGMRGQAINLVANDGDAHLKAVNSTTSAPADTLSPDSSTLSFWMRAPDAQTSRGRAVEIGTPCEHFVGCRLDSPELICEFSAGTRGCGYTYSVRTTLNSARWHHVVFVAERNPERLSDNTFGLRLYLDGEHADTLNVGNITGPLPNNVADPLVVIGRGHPDRTNGDPFSGLVDDVRIYDGALTQEQVSTLYGSY